jgi:hypothetical protein
MSEGRETADILAEWREVERRVNDTEDPFERAELLRRARRLRVEYAHRVDELTDVAGHFVEDSPSTRRQPTEKDPGAT